MDRMGTSKQQRERVERICECGCGETFHPFPVYRPKSEGGGLRYPRFKRGHHPKTTERLNEQAGWNRGMKKGDHPSLERMGFQEGHAPYNDWSHVNAKLRSDPELRARWLASKQGQVAWNKGKTRADYANGMKAGPHHGNWRGGYGGIRDTAEYAQFRRDIFARDNYTCQECGDRNHVGRGSRIRLEVHHLVSVAEAPLMVLEPSNAVTLCSPCHRKTESFGTRGLRRLKTKRQGNGKYCRLPRPNRTP